MGTWIGVVRLVVLGGGTGLGVFYIVTAIGASGVPGLFAVVFALVSVITLALGLAAVFVSPRSHSAFMASARLSARTFRRELLIVTWYVGLAIVLSGAAYASYGS